MNEQFFEEERNLSASETTIMKAIWDAGQDISIPDLIELLRTDYGKDYARTTVVTFLLKLSDKGFVRTYRKGKLSYAHAMKSEADYRTKLLNEETDYWFEGNVSNLFSALCSSRKLTKEEILEIRSLLDDIDAHNAH
ncbi:MAG: BlaI/MecI/CopY family transcriptional regulator [Lachnospiraceae bacterium]|nr:BlaI/MecI/CopY family transcriptional regulator [Lachnospiraceae bacterium]